MPDRRYYGSNYRFGFDGMENSQEIKGSGNSYTAEYWEYDPRFGRRWNVDPVDFGSSSPYATFANNPIWYRDPLGLDTVNSSKKLKNVGNVFRHYNPKTNSNFYYNKTSNGLEEKGSSQYLQKFM